MALHEPRITIPVARVTREVERVLEAGEERVRDFYGALDERSPRGFIPSDYRRAYDVLHYFAGSDLLGGRGFCEWGAGVGVVTCLAAVLGFDSVGIEQDEELFGLARELAEESHSPAAFHRGDFVPSGFDYFTDGVGGSKQLLATGRPEGYDYPGLACNLNDFDLVYVYPYPGELEFTQELFEKGAAEGAYLVTYVEDEEFMIHVKEPA